jgi:prepilin-type N-terminal cleavage/methylation domain-containing protein
MLPARWQRGDGIRAFTVVELIVVVVIVGVFVAIAAIAISQAQEHARAEICRANMQLIEDAKDRWLKSHYGEGDPSQSDLASVMGNSFPVCPDHGTYSGFGIDQSVECSVHGAYRHVAAPQ